MGSGNRFAKLGPEQRMSPFCMAASNVLQSAFLNRQVLQELQSGKHNEIEWFCSFKRLLVSGV